MREERLPPGSGPAYTSGSERGMEPPFIWLDDATVLTFRVEGLKDGGNLDTLKSKLLRVNVDTGAMRRRAACTRRVWGKDLP